MMVLLAETQVEPEEMVTMPILFAVAVVQVAVVQVPVSDLMVHGGLEALVDEINVMNIGDMLTERMEQMGLTEKILVVLLVAFIAPMLQH